MNYEFKGTPGPWLYEKTTERFTACTISVSGKIIGHCDQDDKEDSYNELLRSKATEMFYTLNKIFQTIDKGTQMYIDIEQLLKESTEL